MLPIPLRIAAVILVGALGLSCAPRGAIAAAPRAAAACRAGPDPTVTLSVSRTKWLVGDAGTWASTVAVPTSETQTARAVSWSMPIDSHFSVQRVTGPAKIAAQATITWQDEAGGSHSAQSNTVVIRLSGTGLANQPDAAGVLTVEIGDLARGETEDIAVDVQRVK